MFYKLKYDLTGLHVVARKGQACSIVRTYQVKVRSTGLVNRVDIRLCLTGQVLESVDPRFLIPVRFDNAGDPVSVKHALEGAR